MDNKTIIISCAGMGTRLGIGMTKALIDINGKPLIIHQLELLKDIDDVRIVVGYQAEEVIKIVKNYRKNITFCFNYDYRNTGTAASFSKGLIGAKEWVVSFDGDLLVKPKDVIDFLNLKYECLGGCEKNTDNPVFMKVNKDNEVFCFSKEDGDLEWTGLALLKRENLIPSKNHIYEMIEPLLPIKVKKIDAKEIDTINDYKNAVDWVKRGYKD